MRISKLLALIAALSGLLPGAAALNSEPLDQSSRLTSLVISEIMYHPLERTDGRQLEFVELFNSASTAEDISGYRLDGAIRFVFPAGTVIPARGFLVVARRPADMQAVYGLNGILGPFEAEASLPNDEGVIELRHRTGAVFLEATYGTRTPWPVAPDGAGHSLVLSRPSYGERNAAAWGPSRAIGGSPGALEPATPANESNILINEFLAHTDDPEEDFVELYNHSLAAANLTGFVLTDDPLTNKFVIPAGTLLEPGQFISFRQSQLGFALGSDGETIYLKNADRSRVVDAVRFGGQENGISTGRVPNGGREFYRLETKTPGQSNGPILVPELVINEIMYHPISGDDDDQFVELSNRTPDPMDISGWRIEDGITYTIPANTVLPAFGYLAVARDAARLHSNYTNVTVLGNFDGRLAHSGERIALAKPDHNITTNNGVRLTNTFYIVVEEVTYGDGGHWGQWSDGGGSSLERIDRRADARQPGNWADSDETTKAPWTFVERTGRLDHGNVTADSLQMLLQGTGECLVDNVEVLNGGIL